MEDYKYDVFISYERDGLTTGWIVEHFLPHFRTWVRQTITGACQRASLPIFFDSSQTDPNFPADLKQKVEGVKPGENWDKAIREAIRRSRCMIAIWNPTYFYSDWCNLEWHSFDRRADSTGRNILIAASVYDINSFPPKARARMCLDFAPYVLFGPALLASRQFEGFQNAIKHLAGHIATSVRDAPIYQDWPIAEDAPNPPPPPPIAVSAIRI